MRLYTLILFLLPFMYSCHSHISNYKRTTEHNLAEVFLYLKSAKTNVSLETAIKEETDKGFHLAPIKSFNKKAEIRMYYVGAFNSRFLRQTFQNDSVLAELYQCRVVKRGDSILMLLGNKITAKGKASSKILQASTVLPAFYQNSSGEVLDGNSCLIQIQYQNITKTLSVDLPFSLDEQNSDEQKITKFLKTTCQEYSFEFYESWDHIDSLAFRPKSLQKKRNKSAADRLP